MDKNTEPEYYLQGFDIEDTYRDKGVVNEYDFEEIEKNIALLEEKKDK